MHQSEIDYTRLSFPDPPQDRPFVAINMVMSADGRTVVDGTERGLGSTLDQRLMRELRVHFDVIVNGGGTFRASGTSARLGRDDLEQWRLAREMSRTPIAAVITRSGDLPAERRFFTDTSFEAVVYLSDAAPDSVRRQLEQLGRPVVTVRSGDEAASALAHMRDELGAMRVLVEGGATLNGSLMRAGLVDEYFLTLAPRIVGGRDGHGSFVWAGRSVLANVVQPELRSLRRSAETGELFLRYRFPEGRRRRGFGEPS